MHEKTTGSRNTKQDMRKSCQRQHIFDNVSTKKWLVGSIEVILSKLSNNCLHRKHLNCFTKICTEFIDEICDNKDKGQVVECWTLDCLCCRQNVPCICGL